MVSSKTCHLERVRDATTGCFGQGLNLGRGVIVSNDNGVMCLELFANFFLERLLTLWCQSGRHTRQVRLNLLAYFTEFLICNRHQKKAFTMISAQFTFIWGK